MAAVSFQCTTPEIISEYYDLLETVLGHHELSDKPGQVYNVDETGVSLDPPKQRVCAKRGQKKVWQTGSGNMSNITVVVSVSAMGHILPPFVILKAKISTMASQKGKWGFFVHWKQSGIKCAMTGLTNILVEYSRSFNFLNSYTRPGQTQYPANAIAELRKAGVCPFNWNKNHSSHHCCR